MTAPLTAPSDTRIHCSARVAVIAGLAVLDVPIPTGRGLAGCTIVAEILVAIVTTLSGPDHTITTTGLKTVVKAVILVHNHPSGETEPSRADIDMTAELKTALSLVTITLHDHLIVAGKTVVSFKSLGLL